MQSKAVEGFHTEEQAALQAAQQQQQQQVQQQVQQVQQQVQQVTQPTQAQQVILPPQQQQGWSALALPQCGGKEQLAINSTIETSVSAIFTHHKNAHLNNTFTVLNSFPTMRLFFLLLILTKVYIVEVIYYAQLPDYLNIRF